MELIYIIIFILTGFLIVLSGCSQPVEEKPPSPRPERRNAVTLETLDEKIAEQEREKLLSKIRRRLKPKADAV